MNESFEKERSASCHQAKLAEEHGSSDTTEVHPAKRSKTCHDETHNTVPNTTNTLESHENKKCPTNESADARNTATSKPKDEQLCKLININQKTLVAIRLKFRNISKAAISFTKGNQDGTFVGVHEHVWLPRSRRGLWSIFSAKHCMNKTICVPVACLVS